MASVTLVRLVYLIVNRGIYWRAYCVESLVRTRTQILFGLHLHLKYLGVDLPAEGHRSLRVERNSACLLVVAGSVVKSHPHLDRGREWNSLGHVMAPSMSLLV